MEENTKTGIVHITLKNEELQPYEEEKHVGHNKNTKFGILEPKIEIETLQCVKQEVIDDYDEKPTIEYGIISRDEIKEEKPYQSTLSPKTYMINECIETNLNPSTIGKRVKCQYCSKHFARKAAILDHILRHKWNTKKISFNRKLRAHVLMEDEVEDTNQRKKHTKPKRPGRSTNHPAQQRRNTSDPTARLYACAHCDKCFEHRWQLNSHTPTHSTVRRYACDQCDKTYRWKSGLRHHRLNTHDGEKPHACDYCGARFARSLQAARHELTHTGEPSYDCATCGALFVRQWALTRHVRYNCGVRNHECDVCGKRYQGKTFLERHRKTHTKQEEKPFVCEICGNSYAQAEYLRVHSAAHSEEKKFACGFCHVRFKTKRGVLRHTVKMHI